MRGLGGFSLEGHHDVVGPEGADDDGEELVVFRPEQDHHAAVLGVHAQGFNLGVQHALSIDWAREDLPR